jgi:hypothetical protein
LKCFGEQIPSRKIRNEDREEKLFSEATVHRAIKKMEEHGLLSVIPSKSKIEMNEIVFHGDPDEDQLIKQIRTYAVNITHNVSRLERINQKLKTEKDSLQAELQELYKKYNLILSERETFSQKLIKIKDSSVVIPKESIVSTDRDNKNRIVLVIKS